MKKKLLVVGIVVLICLVGSALCFITYNSRIRKQNSGRISSNGDDNFSTKFFKEGYEVSEGNYLVSPYSVYVALSMLRDGSNGNTYNEIASVIGSQEVNILNNEAVHIADAVFLKNQYKNAVSKDFTDKMVNQYKAQLLYDAFETPAVINNWVKEETDGMIEKVLDEIDKDFVLGLANAIAIDVKWKYQFDCNRTMNEEFTNSNNEKSNVEMMHQTYTGGAKYLSSDKAKGIIIPYEDETNLEFIGILPDGNIKDYVKNFSKDELNKLEESAEASSDSLHVNLSLPRFSYDFDLKKFADVLKTMGIKDVFSKSKADLTGLMTREEMNKNGIENLYVSQSVHKTFVELTESGTKAAAVTFFGVSKVTSVKPERFDTRDIKFDKSFLYIIRDKNTKDILFIGTVEKPNEWKGTTCEKEA